MESSKKPNAVALLPILVFLILYLGLGILFEYGMNISMGFYSVPIVVAFLAAILVACFQNRKLSFEDKLSVMAKGVGDKNIFTMILIFLAAGIFTGVLGRNSAASAAYFLLSIVPAKFSVLVLFLVACFISTAMGTSTGTISILIPIAVNVANVSGFSVPLCVATVVGGAMFGDNLSFISDTTIAACASQGCPMRDKFRANFLIALPAAVLTLIAILLFSLNADIKTSVTGTYELIDLIPYILVFVGGIIGLNVFVVLLAGIVSGTILVLIGSEISPITLLSNAGTGASGMFETIVVTILVSALCALIREYGGFAALLSGIRKLFKKRRGGELGIGLLVGALDIATANNTVAIVVSGPIAKEMSKEYDIPPKRTASILDTFSCIVQGVLPYGAQMLIALSLTAELGSPTSAISVIRYMFYPMLLLFISLIYIFFSKSKKA